MTFSLKVSLSALVQISPWSHSFSPAGYFPKVRFHVTEEVLFTYVIGTARALRVAIARVFPHKGPVLLSQLWTYCLFRLLFCQPAKCTLMLLLHLKFQTADE